MPARDGPAAIVLGPARDPDDDQRRSPLEVRRQIARHLEKAGVPAVILEDKTQQPGEPSIELFLRTLREHHVRTFLLYWPPNAHLHGMDIEIGILLAEIARGHQDPCCVNLLVHQHVIGPGATDPDEDLTWREPGNRTGYYHDLFAYGCPVHLWTTEAELLEGVAEAARHHRTHQDRR